MDARTQPSPLAAEISSLRRFLESAKPDAVLRLETKLHDTRGRRAEKAILFQEACITQLRDNPNMGPSADMLALESELQTFDQEIGKLRGGLAQAREQWAPKFFKAAQSHVGAAEPALLRAAELIEAATGLFTEHDRYASGNGLVSCLAPQKSRKLQEIAVAIRRLIKNRDAK